MLTQLEITNQALDLLGANRITTLGDATVEAETAAAVYPIARRTLLTMHDWTFALKQADLVASVAEPLHPWEETFTLPTDCLRLLRVIAGGTSIPAQPGVGVVYCGASEVAAVYVYDVSAASTTGLFDDALVADLAARLAVPLTSSTSLAADMFRLAKQRYIEARRADLETSMTPVRASNLLLVR